MIVRSRHLLALLAASASLSVSLPASAQTTSRLNAATVALEEILNVPESIPVDLLNKAACLVLVPGLKEGAFIVGAKYGRGFTLCRREDGSWSAPAGVRIEGGSIGFQIGGTDTDLFMLVMNKSGADKLLSTKFTLGGDAAVAAGPVGRQTTALTDAAMRAEILSWSRSRGVFAGISVQGATLREDADSNLDLYGRKLSNREIVQGTIAPPATAAALIKLLPKTE